MELSPGKQLFIDDYFIESLTGARRVLNPPHKLTVDEPLPITVRPAVGLAVRAAGSRHLRRVQPALSYVLPRLDRGTDLSVRAGFRRTG